MDSAGEPRASEPTRASKTAREFDRLARHLERIEHILERPAEELTRVRERVSKWSPAHHLFHVLLANELSLKNVTSLVARKGMLVRPFGGLAEGAADLLARGRLPRGVAEAPRFVRPPAQVDLAFTRALLDSTRALLEDLARDPAAVRGAPDCVPHQALGDLSAAQWARFARLHTAHHLGIVRALLA